MFFLLQVAELTRIFFVLCYIYTTACLLIGCVSVLVLGFLRFFFFFLCNLTNRWLSELCISGITSTSLVWLAITRPQSCQSCFRLCIRARNIGTSKKTIFSQPLLYLFLESLLKFPPSFNPVQNHLGWKLAVKLWQVDVVQLYFNFFFPFIFCLYPKCWKTLGRNQFYLKTSFKNLEYYRYIKFLKGEEK